MDELRLAVELARAAGDVLLTRFGEHLAYEEKSSRRADLVTEADRLSDQLIVSRIAAERPGATIVAEESGTHAGYTDERWFVDPLDGTTNFAHTYPLFCVSIGCERGGELVAGVVYAPKLGELYAAQRGCGARLNDAPIRVSPVSRVADALLCTGFVPSEFEINIRHFRSLSQVSHAVRRDGAAALDLAFVAAGRFDAFWEFGLGGRATAANGSPLDFFGRQILASNGRLHDEMCERLGRSDDGE